MRLNKTLLALALVEAAKASASSPPLAPSHFDEPKVATFTEKRKAEKAKRKLTKRGR